ncbi:MAG: hypothetical protein J7K87_02785 [Candidatus Aenigmarchaeota archaeon]|nr:hypothetical protein [Candidatus Aenigmarchaeota archaeon]
MVFDEIIGWVTLLEMFRRYNILMDMAREKFGDEYREKTVSCGKGVFRIKDIEDAPAAYRFAMTFPLDGVELSWKDFDEMIENLKSL